MNAKWIKAKRRGGRPSRAKKVVLYIVGKNHSEHKESVARDLGFARSQLEIAMRDGQHGKSASLLRLIAALEYVDSQLDKAPAAAMLGDDAMERAGAIAGYVLRLSDRAEARWGFCNGQPGWLTGDSFYSGITSPSTASAEMALYAGKSTCGGNPIDHIVFSWPSFERFPIDVLLAAANAALRKTGFPDDCPRVLAVHTDTNNLHVHCCVSRYRPATGEVWSRGRIYDALSQACRETEIEFGFSHDNGNRVVIESNGEKQIVSRKYLAASLSATAASNELRFGVLSFESFVRQNRHGLEQCLQAAGDWEDLHLRLAQEFGVGVKQHGKGYVITDLSSTKSANCKASYGGLGAPKVEAAIGHYRQSARPLAALRRSAKESPVSYAMALAGNAPAGPTAMHGVSILREARDEKLKAVKRRELAIQERRVDAEKERHVIALQRAATDPGRTTDENRFHAARLNEIKREESRALMSRLDEIKRSHRLPRITALDAGESTLRHACSGSPTVSILGISVLIKIELPGYEIRQSGGVVEYMRGGQPVLLDDGERVHVNSHLSNDIVDAIQILLARDPGAAERGITITGDDMFRDKAMHVIARIGLHVANQDNRMQSAFDLIKSAAESEQHTEHQRNSYDFYVSQ